MLKATLAFVSRSTRCVKLTQTRYVAGAIHPYMVHPCMFLPYTSIHIHVPPDTCMFLSYMWLGGACRGEDVEEEVATCQVIHHHFPPAVIYVPTYHPYTGIYVPTHHPYTYMFLPYTSIYIYVPTRYVSYIVGWGACRGNDVEKEVATCQVMHRHFPPPVVVLACERTRYK